MAFNAKNRQALQKISENTVTFSQNFTVPNFITVHGKIFPKETTF
jgi:hypothetical protein